MGDSVEPFVLRLGVSEEVAHLAKFVLQFQHPLLIVGFLTSRLQNKRLFTALSICSHLPMVGMGLSKSLGTQKPKVNGKELVLSSGRPVLQNLFIFNIYGRFV